MPFLAANYKVCHLLTNQKEKKEREYTVLERGRELKPVEGFWLGGEEKKEKNSLFEGDTNIRITYQLY